MAKLTKRMKAISAKVEAQKVYAAADALALIKETAVAKFDESVDVAVQLGIDPRKSDQAVRGAVVMPEGTGKTVRVAVFTQGAKADEARAAGADIVGFDDLAAKVKALIRRSRRGLSGSDAIIAAGPFQYNTSTLRFYKNRKEIVLSSRENAMMKLFLDNVNRIFPKDMLYELVWGESIVDENAVMVYINRLRQKIEEDPSNPKFIQTVRGLGYRFVV